MPVKLGRISRQKDFDRIWRQGKTWRNKFFVLRLLMNDLPHVRLAVVVSNKISRKAVVRNRLRRQTKEILRQALSDSAKGCDLVFIGQPSLVGGDFLEIKEAAVDLLKKSNV